ncbi:hypothetical protein skT53_11110 [Effusibacillus dendaii]|uniref:Fe-containing alcohol dehydrogenase-like C-terminal domain-containing protein n=1 Tax=Effusibacillus dendaii TaxID=2743772 RepID=A0A7I8DBB5_9BACL|nr:hypothetical protein skT53_11110 [Effusibacillus dendaii]
MDVLTHAIESYVSKAANPVSEAFALQAMKLIGKHWEKIRPGYPYRKRRKRQLKP